MRKIAVFSNNDVVDPGLTTGSQIILYRDEFVSIEASEPLTEEQCYISPEIVCIVVANLKGQATAETINHNLALGVQSATAKVPGGWMIVSYSKRDKRLQIYRDFIGLEHVYYQGTNSEFIVSNSLEWLLNLSLERFGKHHDLNRFGLANYLVFQYVPSPHTLFNGVFQLPPGAGFEVSSTRVLEPLRYTVFPPTSNATLLTHSFVQQVEAIRDLLLQSLEKQIRHELTTAALLSGGMDTSTNIAMLVENLGIKPKAFTATFREKAYDELEFARIVAKRFGVEHVTIPIGADRIEDLPKIVKLFETPHGDRSIFAQFFLAEAARDHGCEQFVTGEGGDEILGYPRSIDDQASLENLPLAHDALARFYLDLTSVSKREVQTEFLARLSVTTTIGLDYLAGIYEEYSAYDPFERLYFGQWRTWLIDGVYMKDRILSDHFGFRLVTPFIDALLMSYMSQVPLQYKKHGLFDKSYLKTAMQGVLPVEVLHRKKHKFWVPFSEWFRGQLHSYLRETLLQSNSFVCYHLGRDLIGDIVYAHQSGQIEQGRLLWALLFLEVWYHEYAHRWI